MHRFFVQVQGRVQGVGFRYFCRELAVKFQITGWVKNEPDGSVVLEAQAEENILDLYFEKVQKGPNFSKVTSFEKKELSLIENDTPFEIRH